MAENHEWISICFGGDLEDVKNLFGMGGLNIEVKGDNGFTPLMYACYGSNIPVITYLIEKGADVNTKEKHGITPFIMFSSRLSYSSGETMKSLIEHGANIKEKDNYGRNVLHHICINGNYRALEDVFDYDFDVDSKDKEGKTPLHYMLERDFVVSDIIWKIVVFLLDHGASLDSIVGDRYYRLKIVLSEYMYGYIFQRSEKDRDKSFHMKNCDPDILNLREAIIIMLSTEWEQNDTFDDKCEILAPLLFSCLRCNVALSREVLRNERFNEDVKSSGMENSSYIEEIQSFLSSNIKPAKR